MYSSTGKTSPVGITAHSNLKCGHFCCFRGIGFYRICLLHLSLQSTIGLIRQHLLMLLLTGGNYKRWWRPRIGSAHPSSGWICLCYIPCCFERSPFFLREHRSFLSCDSFSGRRKGGCSAHLFSWSLAPLSLVTVWVQLGIGNAGHGLPASLILLCLYYLASSCGMFSLLPCLWVYLFAVDSRSTWRAFMLFLS